MDRGCGAHSIERLDMKSPRERTLARIKTLAAAGVVAGCHGSGYGVVDPMPTPSCFEGAQPTVAVKLLEKKSDGTRLVEVVVKFVQTDTKITELGAYDVGGKKLALAEQTINANDFRAVLEVPKDVTSLYFNAVATCGHGSGFTQYIEVTDTEAVAK